MMTIQEQEIKIKALELAVSYVGAKFDKTTANTIVKYAERFELFLSGIKVEKCKIKN